jgi:hypothetical protein
MYAGFLRCFMLQRDASRCAIAEQLGAWSVAAFLNFLRPVSGWNLGCSARSAVRLPHALCPCFFKLFRKATLPEDLQLINEVFIFRVGGVIFSIR